MNEYPQKDMIENLPEETLSEVMEEIVEPEDDGFDVAELERRVRLGIEGLTVRGSLVNATIMECGQVYALRGVLAMIEDVRTYS